MYQVKRGITDTHQLKVIWIGVDKQGSRLVKTGKMSLKLWVYLMEVKDNGN
jgi:hypothetical protein